MKYFRDEIREKIKEPKKRQAFYRQLQASRISAELYEYRKKRNLTQEQLAIKAGTTQPTIARLEEDSYSRYSLSTLNKIAEALDLELYISYRERIIKPSTKIDSWIFKGHLSVKTSKKLYEFDIKHAPLKKVNSR